MDQERVIVGGNHLVGAVTLRPVTPEMAESLTAVAAGCQSVGIEASDIGVDLIELPVPVVPGAVAPLGNGL